MGSFPSTYVSKTSSLIKFERRGGGGGQNSSYREIYESFTSGAALQNKSNIHILHLSPFFPFSCHAPLHHPFGYVQGYYSLPENNSSSLECSVMGSYDETALIYKPSLGIVVLLSICYGVISLGAVVGK